MNITTLIDYISDTNQDLGEFNSTGAVLICTLTYAAAILASMSALSAHLKELKNKKENEVLDPSIENMRAKKIEQIEKTFKNAEINYTQNHSSFFPLKSLMESKLPSNDNELTISTKTFNTTLPIQ